MRKFGKAKILRKIGFRKNEFFEIAAFARKIIIKC